MPINIKRLVVFIAYPNDVKDEMEAVRTICKQLTDEFSSRNIEVVASEWRSDVQPLITGEGPQATINAQIRDYDIYVGLLWTYFGNKQRNGLAPTEEEFENALMRQKETGRPLITFYFKLDDWTPNTPDEREQAQEIQKFKEHVRSLGLYADFRGTDQFSEKIVRNLRYFVDQFEVLTFRPFPIPKIPYKDVLHYIPRRTYPVKEHQADGFIRDDDLARPVTALIETERRIVLLAGGGVGKTVELRHIASYFSNSDLPFYPYFVSLNKYVNQSISDLLPEEWIKIPENRLLLILDGFDEIESKNKKDAIRQIEAFVEAHPDVHFVISCRTNFYKSQTEDWPGTLEGFASYLLLDLDRQTIHAHIWNKLGEGTEGFYDEVEANKLQGLLGIPFYLIHLLELFEVNHQLPKGKSELFEQLLNLRIRGDIEHYRTTIDLDEKRRQVFALLERVALALELLGRNYITEDELEELLPDDEARELLRFSGSFRRAEVEVVTWQFEHNNFQEYLAARVLSRQSLDTIKDFISFRPEHTKIIPSWVNTLSFLVSILNQGDPLLTELIDWITEIESSLVTKFEPDRVEIELRTRIFKSIFEYYKEKQIRINRDKFDYVELARFGRLEDVITYLIGEIENGTQDTSIADALDLLRGTRIPHTVQGRVQDALVKCAVSWKDEYVQNRAILALADLRLNSEEVLNQIVPVLRSSDSDWVRYGLYYFLHTSHHVDDYIDVFLEGIPYLRSGHFVAWGGENAREGGSKTRLGDESFHLNIGLQKATSPDALKKILDHFRQHAKLWGDVYVSIYIDRSIPTIIDHAAAAYQNDQSLFDAVLSLFKELMEQYLTGEARVVSTFFDKTGTRFKAFQSIYNEVGVTQNSIPLLAALADHQAVELFFHEYEQQKFADGELLFFRNLLGPNQNLYERMDKLISDKFPDRVTRPPVRDLARERKERRQRDVSLLFDKQAFIREMERIFETEQKETLTHDELTEVQVQRWDNPYFSDLAIRTLSEMAKRRAVSLENIPQSVNGWDWDFFVISRLYEYLRQDGELELSQEQRAYIEPWCQAALGKVDFKTTLVTKPNREFSANSLAIFLWYFLRRFNLQYPKDVLLDMLSFDWVEGVRMLGIGYLEERLTESDLTPRILKNLQEGITNDDVLKNHLDYGRRHNLKAVLPFAQTALTQTNRMFDARQTALETVFALSESSSDLESVLSAVTDEYRWMIVEELLKRGSQSLRHFLLDVLTTENEEEQLKAARYLMRLQDLAGLQYYVEWIKRHKKVPEELPMASPLLVMQNPDAIPLLLGSLRVSYQDDVQQNDFARLDQAVLSTLRTIALSSAANYEEVKKGIEKFIGENSLLKNVNLLYLFLENLEQQFYISASAKVSVQEVVRRLEAIYRQ